MYREWSGNTLEGQVGVSPLIISLKTEMLQRLAFCCDGKERKGINRRREGEVMVREKARGR
jgi:hypothetical protein